MNREQPKANPTTIIIAIIAALGLSILLLVTMARNPAEALYYFFLYPFLNGYHAGNLLDTASVLILTGLGVSIAFKSGVFNLGGEGQVYLGALVASQLAISLGDVSPFPGTVIVLVGSLCVSALVGGLSGFLKARWKIDELITSFLVSSALIPVIDYAIAGPLRDGSSNLLSTPRIPESLHFSLLAPPSHLNTGIIGSLLLCAATFVLMEKTIWGFEMKVSGISPRFARHAALPEGILTFVPMAASGALHGLAGGFFVLGTRHAAVQGATAGIGWNGIAVALIAENNPLLVIPAALFFAFLETATDTAMLNTSFSFELGAVIRSVVFLFITAKTFQLKRHRAGR